MKRVTFGRCQVDSYHIPQLCYANGNDYVALSLVMMAKMLTASRSGELFKP